MSNINKQIGELIRDTRNQRGLSQREFAKRLTLTQDAVSDLETGLRVLKITELFEIAEVLNIPPAAFLIVKETEAKKRLLASCTNRLSNLPIVLLELVDVMLDRFIRLTSWVEGPEIGIRRIEIDLSTTSGYASHERQPDIRMSGNMILEYKKVKPQI